MAGPLRKHPVGYPVTFKNPTTKEPFVGLILDEVWAKEPGDFAPTAPTENAGWREGAHVAQLIEWPNGNRSVRITYYLRPEGGDSDSWYFAGQYSSSMPIEDFRSLFDKLEQKDW